VSDSERRLLHRSDWHGVAVYATPSAIEVDIEAEAGYVMVIDWERLDSARQEVAEACADPDPQEA